MGKLGGGHSAQSRISGLIDDIVCRMGDRDTMTVASLLSKLFIHSAVPEEICSLEAWHLLFDLPRALSSRYVSSLNVKEEQQAFKHLTQVEQAKEEESVLQKLRCQFMWIVSIWKRRVAFQNRRWNRCPSFSSTVGWNDAGILCIFVPSQTSSKKNHIYVLTCDVVKQVAVYGVDSLCFFLRKLRLPTGCQRLYFLDCTCLIHVCTVHVCMRTLVLAEWAHLGTRPV